MKSRGVIEVLAGQASIVAILALVLFLSIAGTPMLLDRKVVAQRIGADVAVAKAEAIAQVLLDRNDGTSSLSLNEQSFTSSHFPDALAAATQAPGLDSSTLDRLRASPQQPQTDFTEIAGEPHLRYALNDGRGGILLLDVPLAKERAAIGRLFGQSYLAVSTVGIILVSLLLLGSYCLRLYLRGLSRLPHDQRSDLIREALSSDNARRHNLLPWMLTLCALVFVFDLTNTMDPVVGMGYLLAVTLCLSSNRTWHIVVVAGISTFLLLASPIVSPYDANWWRYLEHHSVTLFAILMTGLYGSAHMRKARAEAMALAEAARSRVETEELKVALQRAETAENDRRMAADRLALANQVAGISMWFYDLRNDIVTVPEDTPFVARIGGVTRLSGEEYAANFVHPDDYATYREVFRIALEAPPGGDDRMQHRYRVVNASGITQFIQVHGRILRNRGGKPTGILGVDWDVTREELAHHEVERQTQQLREAQERFQRAVSGTQDALFEINMATSDCWVSPRFHVMTGHAPGDMPATINGLRGLVHPEDLPRLQDAARNHFEHCDPFDVEFRMRCKDGQWLWLCSRATAYRNERGEPTLFSGSIHDTTEARANREALIRASEEAEAASRAKSTFLATMSHEIRTPMNGVIGMTSLLLDTGLDRAQREYAETIRTSADSLLTILNDILDFSKIEAGKLDIENIDFDLVANVDEIGSAMGFQAAAKGLELVVNVRPEVPPHVVGDPQRLRQCLLNLVGNAIKFTQSGEVVVEVCSLGCQNGRALVHFEVRDTGIGIPPESLARLFQPFTQADSSTTRRFGGTGLGLSIVHKLVSLMGGRAGAQSEVGRGSTFWFTLPMEQTQMEEDKAATGAIQGKRVLLVDDNETNRRVLARQMAHAGYDVEVADSGTAALALIRRNDASPFDAVVLDYHMPDMDGAMLGERIATDRSIPSTRLILLTSLDRSGDLQHFSNIGFAAYLTKPVRSRELMDALGRVLAREAQEWHLRSQPMITRNTLIAAETRRRYSGRVLLVEDNEINQRVAQRFLERLGCDVRVVDDGQKAVAAYGDEQWALILMDMQMPVMDGLEATRRIREREAGGARTPIVALTANAMLGQLERCLEAGMDDYLTKPLDIERLQDVLDRFMAQSQTDEQILTAPAAAPVTGDSVRSRIMEIADDDAEFASDLIATFLLGTEETMQELRRALRDRHVQGLMRGAHKLKGAAANLHIEELAELARSLEMRTSNGTGGAWEADVEQIATEFARVSMALRQVMDELAAGKRASAG